MGSGSWEVFNIFRDHLGTITHLKTGSTINEYSFDAWGRRRDKDDWTYTLTSEPDLFAGRGFTAHEYLEDFKLYNMNGRLYDPVVGRFLNADPVIQDPGFTQSYNRYSYCMNNPLKYVDPSGYQRMFIEMPWFNPNANNLFNAGLGSGGGGSSSGCGGINMGTIFNQDGSIHYGGPSNEIVDAWLDSGLNSEWTLSGFSDYYNSGVGIRVITESRELKWTRKNGQPYIKGVKLIYQDITARRLQGQGGAMETVYNVANFLNEFNPIAQLWDLGTYAFTGKDRFGNSMSQGQAYLKALAVIPVGKAGSLLTKAGANAITGFTEHGLNQLITRGFTAQNALTIMREGTAVEAMGRYGMQTRYTLGGNTIVVNSNGKIVTAFSTAADGMFIPF